MAFLRERKLTRHIIQPIQPKADYAVRYQEHPAIKPQVKRAAGPCRYLAKPLMRYFDVNGKELPCCFIKQSREFPGVDVMCRPMTAGLGPLYRADVVRYLNCDEPNPVNTFMSR